MQWVSTRPVSKSIVANKVVVPCRLWSGPPHSNSLRLEAMEAGALQGLHLAILLDLQHRGLIDWVHLQADRLPQLLDKIEMGRQLEAHVAVQLQTEQLSNAAESNPKCGRPHYLRTRKRVNNDFA